MISKRKRHDISSEGLQENHLGWLAHKAIQKHFDKAIRYEAEVLRDTDPEPLHQMRVELRRLRTTLYTYGCAVRLPHDASEHYVKKLSKTLGRVRDLDVLIQRLEHEYRPLLHKKEKRILDRVIATQRKYRKKCFSTLTKALNGKPYKHFKSAYRQWLNAPQYDRVADYSIHLVAPDLVLPLLSHVFLHAGWSVSQAFAQDTIEIDRLHHWLNDDGKILHDLRKQIKLLRYQLEFLSEIHTETLQEPVQAFKHIQELLGQFQDDWVLNQVLKKAINTRWMQKLPTVAKHLKNEQYRLWEAWHPVTIQFLSPTYRYELRYTIAGLTKPSPDALARLRSSISTKQLGIEPYNTRADQGL
ncbi:MAG: CHAD domain-containing protein [Cyanobacteria bacterium P01_E01_bin.6]